MFRQSILKAVRPATRSFSITSRAMVEGATGGVKATGGQGDAFQKREKASEDYAIRQRENEKLMELKKKLAEQHEHLKKLEEHIDEISKNQGGEHK